MTAAGFLLASDGSVDFRSWGLVLLGTALVIASACVVNNVIDREIDSHMTRTERRALVVGAVRPDHALAYAALLGLSGLTVLALYVNLLTAAIGLTGFIAYTVFYSYAKRRTSHGTLVGTISGATPPVAGYTAATDRLDATALLLFLILVFWQMAHFYAIALYRAKEYKQAGLPVLPIVKGSRRTMTEIIVYIVLFMVACVTLSALGYAAISFGVTIFLLGTVWLYRGWSLRSQPAEDWGLKMFLFSLITLVVTALLLASSHWLP